MISRGITLKDLLHLNKTWQKYNWTLYSLNQMWKIQLTKTLETFLCRNFDSWPLVFLEMLAMALLSKIHFENETATFGFSGKMSNLNCVRWGLWLLQCNRDSVSGNNCEFFKCHSSMLGRAKMQLNSPPLYWIGGKNHRHKTKNIKQ